MNGGKGRRKRKNEWGEGGREKEEKREGYLYVWYTTML